MNKLERALSNLIDAINGVSYEHDRRNPETGDGVETSLSKRGIDMLTTRTKEGIRSTMLHDATAKNRWNVSIQIEKAA